jgi:hypothetical protein
MNAVVATVWHRARDPNAVVQTLRLADGAHTV